MIEENKEAQEDQVKEEQDLNQQETTEGEEKAEENKEDEPAEATEENELEALKNELQEQKDKYLRLYSEFENFRRRTAKEKIELISTANEKLILDVLPVIDDFDRAQKSLAESTDVKALQEGLDLIHDKLNKILASKGLTVIESVGKPFDAEYHEGISQVPVDNKKQKGKVIDEVEKGYILGEKVIRYSKVVIGA